MHTRHPSYTGSLKENCGAGQPISKIIKAKRVGAMFHMVEHLSSMHKALSSHSSTAHPQKNLACRASLFCVRSLFIKKSNNHIKFSAKNFAIQNTDSFH
jgi:hypothetical protein